MNRIVSPCAFLLLCIGSTVQATISVGVSGPGTLLSTYEGPVFFPQNGFTGEGTITDWAISGLNPVIKTVDYAQADLDFVGAFGSGFRWAETIVNTGRIAWSDFHISLIDTSGTTSGSGDFLNTPIGPTEVPGFALIVGNVITVLGPGPLPGTGWVMTLSPDQRTIDVLFPTPILPGAGFQVYIPIENLGDGPGTFVLFQQATVIPEPDMVWILLGAMVLSVGRWRQKGTASSFA